MVALEIRKKLLGERPRQSLQGIIRLAAAYRCQRKYQQAEELLVQALTLGKGPLQGHSLALEGMSDLALTYYEQNKFAAAEILQEHVVEIRRKASSEKHPGISTSLVALAAIYQKQGKYQEAETLMLEAIEGRKSLLGDEHPHTLAGMFKLAEIYRDQGRKTEAESLNRSVLEARKRVLGQHDDTQMSMMSLGLSFVQQQRWPEAIKLWKELIELNANLIGAEHPDTLGEVARLAQIYRKDGREEEACELERGMAELRESPPEVASSSSSSSGEYIGSRG